MSETETYPLNLGERIKWAREQAGFSQLRLAQALGTSPRHVIRWEKGQHKPNDHYVKRLAEVTGQDPELFRNEDDDEEPG